VSAHAHRTVPTKEREFVIVSHLNGKDSIGWKWKFSRFACPPVWSYAKFVSTVIIIIYFQSVRMKFHHFDEARVSASRGAACQYSAPCATLITASAVNIFHLFSIRASQQCVPTNAWLKSEHVCAGFIH
jgi:hypothetical protein